MIKKLYEHIEQGKSQIFTYKAVKQGKTYKNIKVQKIKLRRGPAVENY